MASLNTQSNPYPSESTSDYLELEVEISEVNVIDLEVARKFKNQIIPDTLQFYSFLDSSREFPESIRSQVASALTFIGGTIPKQFSFKSIEPFEPIEPDPVSQAVAA